MDFQVLNMLSEIECLVDERYTVSESPLWEPGRGWLFWTHNTSYDVHAMDIASRARHVWHFEGLAGSLGLARSGRLVVAHGNQISLMDIETGSQELLAQIELPPAVWKFNDGKVGPDGAFWVGTMAHAEPKRLPAASLYRVSADGRVETKIDGGIMVSNGLAWSPDGTRMYHSDSQGMWIDIWDFDAQTGEISNRRRFAEPDRKQGLPDGAAIDIEGYYWSGAFSACAFNRFAPDGTLAGKYPVPAACSMPCFGGDDMQTLFFTSLSEAVRPEEVAHCPQTGGVFMARSQVAGLKIDLFAD